MGKEGHTRMRIAVLNTVRAFGGGEKWVIQFSAGLRGRGEEVLVLAHPGSELLNECRRLGIPAEGLLVKHQLAPATALTLGRRLRGFGPDVLICCDPRAARAGSLALRIRPDARLVYRNGLAGSFGDSLMNRHMVAPMARRFVVNAEALADELRGFGWIPRGKIAVIANGVELPPLTERRRPADGAAVLLSAGRLVRDKGHRYLVEAMALLVATHPGARLLIAGTGEGEAELSGQIERLGLRDRVSLLGFVADMRGLMGSVDLLVHPSLREGAPNVVLEAMAGSLPVVATDVDGSAEIVNAGVTGILVPPADPGAISQAVSALLDDPDRMLRLGAAGRSRVIGHFSVGTSLDRWQSLLREVMAEGRE